MCREPGSHPTKPLGAHLPWARAGHTWMHLCVPTPSALLKGRAPQVSLSTPRADTDLVL